MLVHLLRNPLGSLFVNRDLTRTERIRRRVPTNGGGAGQLVHPWMADEDGPRVETSPVPLYDAGVQQVLRHPYLATRQSSSHRSTVASSGGSPEPGAMPRIAAA